jgi:hypothetical protein
VVHKKHVPSSVLDPPPPLSQACVPPTPETKGEGAQSPAGKGGGGSPNSDDGRKSLALCLLCGLVPFAGHSLVLDMAGGNQISSHVCCCCHSTLGTGFPILLPSSTRGFEFYRLFSISETRLQMDQNFNCLSAL